jgi:hypothetical protein
MAKGGPLCKICSGEFELKDLRPLVKDAKYVCAKCGRAAASKGSLCKPSPIKK